MKGGTQAALALGVGYVLGRRRKLRLTTMLAIGAATGGIGGVGGSAVKRGMKMLGSTEALGKVAPQLGEIADTVRGDLLDAGKAAAVAVATNRIGSLTDSLHEHAQRIREPAGAVADQAGEVTKQATGRIPRQRGQDAASDEDFETSRDEAAEPENGDEEARGNGRRRAPARRRTARAGSVVTRTRTPAASRTRR
jgi:hypothetical protein